MGELVALTGEPLAVDLINTVPNTPQGRVDLLSSPSQLRTWLDCQADRFPELAAIDTTAVTTRDMTTVHAVREHARAAIEAVRHGEPAPPPAIEALNAALREAPGTRELTCHDDGTLSVVLRRTGDPATQLAAELAEATAEFLTSSEVAALRQCAADFCVLLFVPTHPRRRWCSPTICGNRARVARYYQRHKDEHGSAAAS